jgi:hypothetical protein
MLYNLQPINVAMVVYMLVAIIVVFRRQACNKRHKGISCLLQKQINILQVHFHRFQYFLIIRFISG